MSGFDPGYPVYVYHEGLELPTEGTYFLIAGNGLWLHKDTGIVKAFVPVDNISVLQDLDVDGFIQCKLPKLPAKDVWRIKTFFKKVVEQHHSEASTSLFFNKQTNEYKVYVPKQRVSHGGVKYDRSAMTHLEEMQDFLCVGTIHSHCDFGAFHSGTDIGDEEDFDGLHVTFGNNNLDEFSISACIVVNGYRLQVDPLTVLDGIEPVPSRTGFYKLATLAPELEAEWSTGLDDWMINVSSAATPLQHWWNSHKPLVVDRICRGDEVTWAGNLCTVSFKDMCGEGPFKVEAVADGLITISTKIGLARFNEKLFKKA